MSALGILDLTANKNFAIIFCMNRCKFLSEQVSFRISELPFSNQKLTSA